MRFAFSCGESPGNPELNRLPSTIRSSAKLNGKRNKDNTIERSKSHRIVRNNRIDYVTKDFRIPMDCIEFYRWVGYDHWSALNWHPPLMNIDCPFVLSCDAREREREREKIEINSLV